MLRPRTALVLAAGLVAAPTAWGQAPLPRYDHVVVVIEENHSYNEVIGSPNAPYINSLAQQGASFTNSHGVEHPSLPNYLDLFSGSNQGVTSDTNPTSPFSTPNLGASLLGAGLSFGSYSEDLPAVGSTVAFANGQNYARKHNPAVDWQPTDPSNPQANAVPASANMPFQGFFPTDFTKLPTVSFVVPNQSNDMHGVSPFPPDSQLIQTGDTWLQTNLDAYAQWAKTHNSLLVVTWDEDDFTPVNQVATIFSGQGVVPGQYADNINHYNVLRTLEEMYGLPYAGGSADTQAIRDAFGLGAAVPEPSSLGLLGLGMTFGLGLLARRRLLRRRAA
jgi:hypothetical protein